MGIFDSLFGGGGNVSVPDPSSYLPLVQASADINRVNQSTPFGGIRYGAQGGSQPMDFNAWQASNPAPTRQAPIRNTAGIGRNSFTGGDGQRHVSGEGGPAYDPQAAYQSYVGGFQGSPGKTTAEQYFSPELQSLFSKQFDPDAYNQYSTDYMDRYNKLLEPGRTRQQDQFQQGMFSRGLPEGSDVYGDMYRTTVGDPNARQDLMAAQGAAGASDNARLQDFNRLMAAMGGSQVNVPQIDTMGAANMAMNADMANLQSRNQNSSNIWNTIAGLGTGMAMGGTGLFG